MSRSVKHTPCCIICATKENKKFANKRVRNRKGLYNGMSYKKLFNSWDIVDYKDIRTIGECKKLTDNEYKKYYVRK